MCLSDLSRSGVLSRCMVCLLSYVSTIWLPPSIARVNGRRFSRQFRCDLMKSRFFVSGLITNIRTLLVNEVVGKWCRKRAFRSISCGQLDLCAFLVTLLHGRKDVRHSTRQPGGTYDLHVDAPIQIPRFSANPALPLKTNSG